MFRTAYAEQIAWREHTTKHQKQYMYHFQEPEPFRSNPTENKTVFLLLIYFPTIQQAKVRENHMGLSNQNQPKKPLKSLKMISFYNWLRTRVYIKLLLFQVSFMFTLKLIFSLSCHLSQSANFQYRMYFNNQSQKF